MTLDDRDRESSAIAEGEQIGLLDSKRGQKIGDVIRAFDRAVGRWIDAPGSPMIGARSDALGKSANQEIDVHECLGRVRSSGTTIDTRLADIVRPS